jgi:hypothetical protein
MKRLGRNGIVWAVLILTVRTIFGALSDLEIHCAAKKIDEAVKGSSQSMAQSKEHWRYDVTVENKTFKDMSGLEVKYITFYKPEELGTREEKKLQRQNGSFSIPVLKPHEKKSFSTNPVELKNAQLTNDYYYADGGRQAAHDRLEGLWVRVYQGGQQVGEYANPSTLMKEKWE